MSLLITPATKIGALLEAYPETHEVLMEWVPALSKLKNPVLLETVTKVATLEQAAKIGGVSVQEVVLKLRKAAGQTILDVIEAKAGAPTEANGTAPMWLKKELVRKTIDATSMLEKGVHPLGTVKESVVALKANEIVELTSAFRPQPLIDAMASSGLAVYSHETSPGQHSTYFCRTSDDPELVKRVAEHSCGEGSCG